jgi:hypothetical protein
MGSVKLKDLKAFVRYDGSGRVVSGSLVFRKKKPKNGRWVEITKNECCSETPSSTTTTTTQGGGVTPTAFIQIYWFIRNNACTSTADGQFVVYSASSTLSEGSTVFTDAALTIPVQFGYIIMGLQMGATKYLVGQGGVLSVLDCTNSFTLPFWYGINQSCTEPPPPQSPGIFYSVSYYPLPGSYMFTDAALTIPVPQGYVIRFGFQNYLVGEGGVLSYFSCSTTTTSTTAALITVGTTSESCGTPSTFATVSFVTGSDICDTVVQLQGSFSMFPSEFYVIYGGFSRLFSKISDSIIQGAGGAPGECVSCG